MGSWLPMAAGPPGVFMASGPPGVFVVSCGFWASCSLCGVLWLLRLLGLQVASYGFHDFLWLTLQGVHMPRIVMCMASSNVD